MNTDSTSLAESQERGRLCGRLAAAAVVLSLGLAAIVFFADAVFEWSGLKIFTLALYAFVFALFFSIAAYAHAAFFRRAMQEEEERILLEKRKESVTSILDVSEDVRFTAKRSFRNFEKYFPPILAAFSFLIGALILYLFQRPPSLQEAEAAGESAAQLLQLGIPKNPVNLAFLSVVCAAFGFFGGIFLVGQSHVREYRYLRPAGNYLMLGGAVMLLSAASALFYIYGKKGVETWCAKLVFALYCVLTVEFIISFVIEFYRPRTESESRPVYESRILAWFTEPGGVVRNIAVSLDYQFGFKVSKTSLYQFAQKVFAPALIVWLFCLWLFTVLAEVGPGELGIRERFGAALPGDLEPGVHWKLPWPFERIVRVPVDKLQLVTVGSRPNSGNPNPPVILWTGTHYTVEDPFLVAAKESGGRDISYSVAILETSLPIYYRAKRSEIRSYAFQFKDIPSALLAVGKSEATAYFASTDFLADISDAREKVCSDLRTRIQKQCDELDMGVEIVSVGMMDAHPPIGKEPSKPESGEMNTAVAAAFQLEVIAKEETKRRRDQALAYQVKMEATASVEAFQIEVDAKTYQNRVITLAEAEKKGFEALSSADRRGGDIFKLRTWLEFLTRDCEHLRKFVVSKELLSRIYEFNFEEKQKIELLDAPDSKNPTPSDEQ